MNLCIIYMYIYIYLYVVYIIYLYGMCEFFIDIYNLRIGVEFMNILQTSIKQAYLVIDAIVTQ